MPVDGSLLSAPTAPQCCLRQPRPLPAGMPFLSLVLTAAAAVAAAGVAVAGAGAVAAAVAPPPVSLPPVLPAPECGA